MTNPEEALILIVEDFEMLRNMLHRRMLMAGYQYTYTMQTAGEMFGYLCGPKHVDLIVIDLMLDHRDAFPHGCAAGAHVRKFWPSTRQLYMTGFGQFTVDQLCDSDTMWIAKPFALEEFLAKIAEALSK